MIHFVQVGVDKITRNALGPTLLVFFDGILRADIKQDTSGLAPDGGRCTRVEGQLNSNELPQRRQIGRRSFGEAKSSEQDVRKRDCVQEHISGTEELVHLEHNLAEPSVVPLESLIADGSPQDVDGGHGKNALKVHRCSAGSAGSHSDLFQETKDLVHHLALNGRLLARAQFVEVL